MGRASQQAWGLDRINERKPLNRSLIPGSPGMSCSTTLSHHYALKTMNHNRYSLPCMCRQVYCYNHTKLLTQSSHNSECQKDLKIKKLSFTLLAGLKCYILWIGSRLAQSTVLALCQVSILLTATPAGIEVQNNVGRGNLNKAVAVYWSPLVNYFFYHPENRGFKNGTEPQLESFVLFLSVVTASFLGNL